MAILLVTMCIIFFFQQSLGTDKIDKSKYLITTGRPSNKLYPSSTQICCNGIIHDKPNSNIACCGNQIFHTEKEICCNNSVSHKTKHLKCCFNELYNSKTHKCDFVNSERRTSDWSFRKYEFHSDSDSLVVIKITVDKVIACGKEIINIETHICCQEKPVPISSPDYANCCGDKAYNPIFNFCCHSQNPPTLLPARLNGENDCCKGKPYNNMLQDCFVDNGTVIDLPDPFLEICGDQIIDIREKICCREKVGEKLKDVAFMKQKSDDFYCCGNISFSLSENICCNGTLIPRNGALKCCYGNGPYDPSIDTCCYPRNYITDEYKSKLYKNKIGSCCYLNLYDETKESCCGVSVIPKEPGNLSGCCEYQLNGTDATLDELINSYKRKFKSIFL